MLYWSVISLASFLILASLDKTICGTLPKSGVNLKPLSVPEVSAARVNKTIVDSHVDHQGHNSPAQQNSPAKDQSSMHRREKQLTDIVGSNDTHDKTDSINPDDTHSLQRSSFIAFTVTNKGPQQGPYSERKIVTFNQVRTNIGGGFDSMFNVFICKESGVYFFTVSVLGGLNTVAYIDLMHDGISVANAHARSPHYSGGTSAYLHVLAGGRVWVSLFAGSAIHGGYNSFSGSLVKPDAAM